jgi:hypothetical protein
MSVERLADREQQHMRTKAKIEIDADAKSFGTGLLPRACCSAAPKLPVHAQHIGPYERRGGRTRWVIRCGNAPANADRPVDSCLWLYYTNFDCNLHCDYCCVRSSPKAPRRKLGLARVRRIANEAAELGVSHIFVTGGEALECRNI